MIHSVAGVSQAEQVLQLRRLEVERAREEREKLALPAAALARERRESSDECVLDPGLGGHGLPARMGSVAALGRPSPPGRTPSQIAAISALPGVVKGELEQAQQAQQALGGTQDNIEGLTKATVSGAVDVLLRATKDKFNGTVRIQKRLADEALQNITEGDYPAPAPEPSDDAARQRAAAAATQRSSQGGRHAGSALHSLAASPEQSQLDLWESLSAEVAGGPVPPITKQDEERVESVFTHDLFGELLQSPMRCLDVSRMRG